MCINQTKHSEFTVNIHKSRRRRAAAFLLRRCGRRRALCTLRARPPTPTSTWRRRGPRLALRRTTARAARVRRTRLGARGRLGGRPTRGLGAAATINCTVPVYRTCRVWHTSYLEIINNERGAFCRIQTWTQNWRANASRNWSDSLTFARPSSSSRAPWPYWIRRGPTAPTHQPLNKIKSNKQASKIFSKYQLVLKNQSINTISKYVYCI